MVTEAAVIGVLGDSHQLNGIVAVGLDAGEHLLPELIVGMDAFFFTSHAHVGFVDQRGFLGAAEGGVLPEVWFFGCPHLGVEDVSLLVLDGAEGPGRNPLA